MKSKKDWGTLDMLEDSRLDNLEYRIEQLEAVVTALIYVVCAGTACAIISVFI